MAPGSATTLSNLLRSSSIEDHDEILKAANASLKSTPNDDLAQRTRIVALLKLDRFDDALRAIHQSGERTKSLCLLETAYALYKTGKLEEAAEVLNSVGEEEKSLRHMAAQVAYRAGKYSEAWAIYDRLMGTGAGEESDDIGINMMAVKAQNSWNKSQPSGTETDSFPETFELCYNAACLQIAHGSFNKALSLLQEAIKLCDTSDELAEADKRAELRPILVQQGYVLAKLNKLEDARNVYQKLGRIDGGNGDAEAAIVAQNNLTGIEASESSNPYVTQYESQVRAKKAQQAKLSQRQLDLLSRNNIVTDLRAHKIEGVLERTSKLRAHSRQPSLASSVNNLSVLNAAVKARGKAGKTFRRSASEALAKRPGDVGYGLSVVQMQTQLGEIGSGLSVLKALLQPLEESQEPESNDIRFSPGIVALMVSLLRAQGRHAAVRHELTKAAEYWKSRPALSASSLFREAGIELLRSSSQHDLAASSFRKLLSENSDSPIASAGLVASLAPTDPLEVQVHASKLPDIDSLTSGIDIPALLSSGIASITPQASSVRKRPVQDDNADRASRKRRKRKQPKNYIEGKMPDPERWLPLRDRSTYRPKGKKGKKKAADSTQGGLVKAEETLELVGGGGVKVEKSGSGGGNKKKKKGKK